MSSPAEFGPVGYHFPRNENFSLIGGECASYKVEQGGLAGSITANDGDEIASVHEQVQWLQRSHFVDAAPVKYFL
jgi:hypothetical protein